MSPASWWKISIFGACLLWLPLTAVADITPIWFAGGNACSPSPNDQIRMEAEEVTIRLKKTQYVVDAVFHFSNPGEQTTEWIGFPKFGMGAQPQVFDFLWFEAWVDGRKTSFLEDGARFAGADRLLWRSTAYREEAKSRWMVHEVTFAAQASTTIRVRYAAHYGRSGGAKYLYGTGRYWKGTIGKAVFIIDCADVGGVEKVSVGLPAMPGREVLSKDMLRFEIRDVEPSPGDELVAGVKHERKEPLRSGVRMPGIPIPMAPPPPMPARIKR